MNNNRSIKPASLAIMNDAFALFVMAKIADGKEYKAEDALEYVYEVLCDRGLIEEQKLMCVSHVFQDYYFFEGASAYKSGKMCFPPKGQGYYPDNFRSLSWRAGWHDAELRALIG